MHVRATFRAVENPGESPFVCDPAGNRTIVVLPEAYDGFLASLSLGAPGRDAHGLPWLSKSNAPGCGVTVAETLRIDGIVDGGVYVYDSDSSSQWMTLGASVVGGRADRRIVDDVEFVVDGKVIGRSRAPFRVRYQLERGDHELVVRPANARTPVRSVVTRFSVR